jgi:hypothetical protein
VLPQKARENPVLSHAAAGKLGGRGKKASHKVTSFRGNGQTYLLRRLAYDAPPILDAYERGEYRSVRAAARRAYQETRDAYERLIFAAIARL